MKELNMSIYTGANDANKVLCTAVFETHAEAVAFHQDLAELCNRHSIPARKPWKLLGHKTMAVE